MARATKKYVNSKKLRRDKSGLSSGSMPKLTTRTSKSSGPMIVTARGLRICMSSIIFVIVVGAFALQVIILRQHQQQYTAKMLQYSDGTHAYGHELHSSLRIVTIVFSTFQHHDNFKRQDECRSDHSFCRR
jgi:hypothetical protein